jgi:hypothetical protein
MYRFPPDASGSIDFDTATIEGVLAVVNGGTEADNATDARTNLSAAKSGANSDITSLSACTTISGLTTPLSQAQGGTGSARPILQMFTPLMRRTQFHAYAVGNTGSATNVGTSPTITGSASNLATTNGFFGNLTSGTVVNDAAGIATLWPSTNVISRNTRAIFYSRFKTGPDAADITGCRLKSGFSSSTAEFTSDTPTGHRAIVTYIPSIHGSAFFRTETDNATGTPDVTVTSVAVTADTEYEVLIDFSDLSKVDFYMSSGGSELALVNSTTTKMPTASNVGGFVSAICTVVGGEAKEYRHGIISLTTK